MPTSQTETLRMYTALRLLQPSWGGNLLLGVGLNDAGRALAFASLAAGAAALFLESDPDTLRNAQREGCCTFAVTTLGEALRILKNEVRQRRAVSVAVRSDVPVVLDEIVDRGVQPEVCAVTGAIEGNALDALDRIAGRGAQVLSGLDLIPRAQGVDLETVLANASDGWLVREHTAASLTERRSVDAALISTTTDAGRDGALLAIHRDWLRSAPMLFPRDRVRAFWIPVSRL